MITIDVAIQVLEHMPSQDTVEITQEGREAIRLGAEALKTAKQSRERQGLWILPNLLSGETRD